MKRAWLKWAGLAVLAVPALYLGFHAHPHALFPYVLRHRTIALHARQPLPPRAAAILQAADDRLQKSPLYRPNRVHDVFLCDTPGLYAVFSPINPRTGGETFFWLGNDVFLRPSNLETDRLVGPSGNEVEGERTLTYFLAHELTHALTADALGLWSYVRLERWQQDGYADYVGKGGAFDFERQLAAFQAHAPELDPERSGLYLRYQLLVQYLLEEKKLSVDELLSAPRPAAPIEAELSRNH